MKSMLNAFYLTTAFLLISSQSIAAAPTVAESAPANDATNYLSDRIKWSFSTSAKKVDMQSPTHNLSDVCIPGFTSLKGIGKLKVGSEILPAFTVESVGTAPCTGNKVATNDVVVIQPEVFSSTPPDRYGLTYGTLLVPFKYQAKGSKDFTGSTSLGGYLGFRQDRSGYTGLALQYVAFLGGTIIQVPTTTGTTTTNQDRGGISYGLGILGTVKDSFHMGLVVGADHVSPSAGYVNNNKPWVAVSLGFSFSN